MVPVAAPSTRIAKGASSAASKRAFKFLFSASSRRGRSDELSAELPGRCGGVEGMTVAWRMG
eukprot:6718534-Alexandrium_andersonii.AAC.1